LANFGKYGFLAEFITLNPPEADKPAKGGQANLGALLKLKMSLRPVRPRRRSEVTKLSS